MNGKIAISTAGHDAGEVYIIVGSHDNLLLLADGITKTLKNPKKKNKKHLMIHQGEESEALKQMISDKKKGCDEAIRHSIRRYKKQK